MATTYVSPKAASGVQPRQDLHDDTVYSEFDIAADVGTAANGGGGAGDAAFIINDVVQMIKVAANTVILGVFLSVDFLDTGTAVISAVGDGDDEDRFITASTIGRSSAMGCQNMNNHAGHLYVYAAADTIDFKITTAATTASTSGKIRLSVRTTMQS